jgi:ribosomal protein S18 acetylase RimI-like enzyme
MMLSPQVQSQNRWHIRLYQPSDRAAVFQLCGDSAHFGEPIERFFDARRLFLDTFATYYTDVRGDYLWIAEDESGALAGYLMGCPDTSAYNRWFRRHARTVMWRFVTLRYRGLTRRTLSFIWRYLHLRVPYLDLSPYPAHLHINTRADRRGQGIGTQLMTAYLEQLRRERIRGVHLETSSENRIAVPWYEKLGFRLLQRSSTDLYRPSVGHDIDLLIYGLRLGPFA